MSPGPTAPVTLVRACTEFDTQTQTCMQEQWVVFPSFLPPLSTEGAADILKSAALLFAMAWSWKKLGQSVNK